MVLPPPLSTAKILAVLAAPKDGAAISVVSKNEVEEVVPVTARPVEEKVATLGEMLALEDIVHIFNTPGVDVLGPYAYISDSVVNS